MPIVSPTVHALDFGSIKFDVMPSGAGAAGVEASSAQSIPIPLSLSSACLPTKHAISNRTLKNAFYSESLGLGDLV